jgi:hypothetical protein
MMPERHRRMVVRAGVGTHAFWSKLATTDRRAIRKAMLILKYEGNGLTCGEW